MPARGQDMPVSENARYAHGVALYRQGRYAEAAETLADLRRCGGPVGQVGTYYEGLSYRALGLEALDVGCWEAAERHLKNAADTLGGDADLTSYFASLYANTGRYEKCVGMLERPASGQDTVLRVRRLVQAQWRSGRRHEAYLTLRSALRRMEDDSDLLIQMGLLQSADDDLDAAAESMAAAVACDCGSARAHYHLGLVEAARKNVPAALRAFQRAFELRPTDMRLAYQLAITARAATESGCPARLRLPDTAAASERTPMRQMAAYLAAEPDLIGSFLSLPRSEVDAQLFSVIESVLHLSLVAHAGYADLQYYHAAVLERLDRVEESLAAAERAVALNGRYAKAVLLCARLQRRLGRDREALASLRRAISAGADYPDVHCRAAEILLACGSRRAASTHLTRALQLNPTYTKAAEAMASLAA